MTSPNEPGAALPNRGPNGEPLQRCRACGALMYFRRNPATGKYTPVALATGESHYKDCNAPYLFSRKTPRAKS